MAAQEDGASIGRTSILLSLIGMLTFPFRGELDRRKCSRGRKKLIWVRMAVVPRTAGAVLCPGRRVDTASETWVSAFRRLHLGQEEWGAGIILAKCCGVVESLGRRTVVVKGRSSGKGRMSGKVP
jgi:hypothetical protein